MACAERLAPMLVPAGMPAGVAAAVLAPAVHAVGATPRTGLVDFGFVRGRMPFEGFRVNRQARVFAGLDGMQRVCQGHVAMAVVVAVGFAVGGDVHELSVAAAVIEAPASAGWAKLCPLLSSPSKATARAIGPS